MTHFDAEQFGFETSNPAGLSRHALVRAILSLTGAKDRTTAAGRLLAIMMLVATATTAAAQERISDSGGVIEGARIFRVTQLGDSGPGSLRTALSQGGPRVIVFEVAGYIDLKSDLVIGEGKVTIAGQTAPGPGIVIRGGGIAIRSSDVVIEHLAIYPGSAPDPKIAENRDGVSLYGSPFRQNWLRNIVLRHVSVGWGVDENIGVQGLVDGFRLENSLLAEPLRRGGHPKGAHAMNFLLGNTVRGVEILGNIMAAGDQRNPRLTQGNVVSMQNNFVYGYGRAATHVDSSKEIINPGAIDIIGNAYRATVDSRCGQPIIDIGAGFFDREPRTSVFLRDNISLGSPGRCGRAPAEPKAGTLAPEPGAPDARWPLKPAASVYPTILSTAGARPNARNPIDQRILAAIADESGRVIDDETVVGGWPPLAAQTRALSLPVPTPARLDRAGAQKLARWLCDASQQVSGTGQTC